jgi:hypothetical protein
VARSQTQTRAAIAGGLIGLAEDYLAEWISQGIIFDLCEQLFDRLVHQSVGVYTHNRTGEVMSRIGNDVNDIENVVADTVFGVANNPLVAGTTLALMLVFDWRLTLVGLVTIPLLAVPMRRAGRRVYAARGATQRKLASVDGSHGRTCTTFRAPYLCGGRPDKPGVLKPRLEERRGLVREGPEDRGRWALFPRILHPGRSGEAIPIPGDENVIALNRNEFSTSQ